MTKTPNTHGGGARTNANGLKFEQTTSLNDALIAAGYQKKEHVIYNGNQKIGMSVPQKQLYTYFLIPNNIDYREHNSKE